jgi:L-ribulose-5-phosphate 4-epimerase
MTEKGYVQFDCHHDDGAAPRGAAARELCTWRDRLHDAGLIGTGADGIGFGNISVWTGPGTFLITGTATGGIPRLGTAHLTEVVAWDIDANRLRCRGPVVASSEALSHAAIYQVSPAACAVAHAHDARAWERLRGHALTTDPRAEAGTPAMARAIQQALGLAGPANTGILVMGGHPDGLLAFGPSLADAALQLLQACEA